MKESLSEPVVATPDATSSKRPIGTSQSEALKAAIQIQVQIESLSSTAQAAAKQARLLTQYVSVLGQVRVSILCARGAHGSQSLTRGRLSLAQVDEELVQEHTRLAHANAGLTQDLAKAQAEGDAWRALAQNVQEMQEVAMAAFARSHALEKENVALRAAMHAFAEGSPSNTVQELQRIIVGLTEEIAQYKKREEDIKAKEATLRNKENHSIIKAMRKQTKELKVRTSSRARTSS